MELTTTLIAVIIITGLVSSGLSVIARLIYDGIKTKINNENSQTLVSNNEQISVNLALLVKDIDFNNKKLAEIERCVDRQVELSIESNVHLNDLKISVADQSNIFKGLIAALTSTITRLENKL